MSGWDVDACEVVKGMLQGWGCGDVSLKRLDSFTGKEGVVVRELPCVTVSEELDGSRIDDYLIHIVVRSRSEQAARGRCRAIEAVLDRMPIRSANGSYRWIATEVYTHAQQLPLDEASFYAYDLRLRVQMEIERK